MNTITAQMLQELFTKQKESLETFFSEIEIGRAERLLEEVLACRGVVFFTGIGKSGFIAQKIASTMMSTGTKAAFLPPIDALHGDLGMVSKQDLVIILSKSGETDELLELLPFVRSRGAKVSAVTSNPEGCLAKGVDFPVFLPCPSELCPFDLAPTISSEVQLLFGDVLAVAVMRRKGFTLDEYAANHPGGRIGRRASLKVRQMMLDKERTPLCFAEDKLEEVLVDFSEKRCGCLIVIDEQKELKGIFTDGDLRRALQAKGEKVLKEKVGNLMTRRPKAIDADALAWDAMKLMEADQKCPVMVLPVIEKSEVIGIIKMHDLIQAGV
ncbi:MAG: KpsF/GutQ family sugar-phosphate isomerase [Chlamydiales bacterium]|nr:KpsF/GutQ family sugar-phosphate isomerase [Chlamydiales bacterium]